MAKESVTVVGAGLAGSEAAWQLAARGIDVSLYEMRPFHKTPAHQTGYFAELVCSNSLRAISLENAVGLLKEEMRRLGSLIIKCADAHQVPAGGALAVDREGFAKAVTKALEDHPRVKISRKELLDIPGGITILATGPLTSQKMSASLKKLTGEKYLYFYDAVAPIVTLESINQDIVFRSSRYGKGEAAYLNCPLNKDEYDRFIEGLVQAERAAIKEFEKEINFEGCMPVEVMAARGPDTLRYGPLKPVGLEDPRTGKRPYAVVQLRQDNAEGTLYNMVGFQTNIKWGEQKRIFRMIPGLENAEFVRFGVMHRNTYVNSPSLLDAAYQCKNHPGVFFAGQMTGVEGYVESAASGLIAGLNAARLAAGYERVFPPRETAHGALGNYITTASPLHFQPMSINFGLFSPLEEKIRNKRQRNNTIAQRALVKLAHWIDHIG